MTTLTLAEVAAIREAAKKATGGPWEAYNEADDSEAPDWSVICEPIMRSYWEPVVSARRCRNAEANAAHIANLSPERVIALCEAWEALRELVDADKMRIAARAAGTHDGERDNLMRKANHTENAAVARARALFADKEG